MIDFVKSKTYVSYRAFIVFACICHLVGGGLACYHLHQIQQSLASITAFEPVQKTPEPEEKQHPHQEQIASIEKQAGMPLKRLSRLLIRDEGLRTRPYLDNVGSITIGVGRSLSTNGISISELYSIVPNVDNKVLLRATKISNGRIKIPTLATAKQIFKTPLSQHDVELLLIDDLKNVHKEAVSVFGSQWESISEARKEAILDVLFNTGLTHFRGFKSFIASVKSGNWKKASNDLLDSAAARQNTKRYLRNARVIETGRDDLFQLDK